VRSTLKATLLELLGMLKEVSAIAVSQDVLSLQWNYYTAVPIQRFIHMICAESFNNVEEDERCAMNVYQG
jgi:hypothetical protein